LNEEEQSDKQLRTQFSGRWSRTPSEKLTESIRTEAARYRQIIDNAVNADGVVRQRFAEHREGIDLLSRDNVSVSLQSYNR
jgi:programmed cell death 6-interacting protein